MQPQLDFSPVASSVVVSEFHGRSDTAARIVTVARELWTRRRLFDVPWVSPDELVKRIESETARPVLVSEAHDAPSGGAAGDHTGLLEILLPRADHLKCCLWILDPAVVAQASAAGAGERINVEVGAKIDRRWAKPIGLTAMVERLTDGEFVFRGPAFQGMRVSMGPSAVLSVDKIRIVVASRSVYGIDPEMFRSQGIEPRQQDVVGLKSPTLFRAAYNEISRTILYLDMPGPCCGRLNMLPYRSINRPIFPLDEFAWEPAAGNVQRITRESSRQPE